MPLEEVNYCLLAKWICTRIYACTEIQKANQKATAGCRPNVPEMHKQHERDATGGADSAVGKGNIAYLDRLVGR